MPKVDSNDALVNSWKVWRFVGAYPPENFKWLYTIYAITITFVANIVWPLFAFLNIFVLGDLESVMRNLEVSPSLIVASLKHGVVIFGISNLYKVKSYLNELDVRANRNDEEMKYLRKIIYQCQLMSKVVYLTLTSALITYAILGLIKKRLPFEGWFPIDWTASTSNYIIAFSFQYFATAVEVAQNAANDTYPPIFINVLIGHIHVLGMRVARIGKDPTTTPEENYNELKSCVRDHRNIIRLFETVKPIISWGVMLQYIITAFVMCVSVINYVQSERRPSQLALTLIYVFTLLAEVYPVCYLGNTLMDETENLTTAIYNCNWVDQSLKFRKAMIIFMQRSQQPNIILAGRIAVISLQTFISIIKFSFSMFTVLSQIY